MPRNPVLNAELPKEEHETRAIWTVEDMAKTKEILENIYQLAQALK